jgi:Flp pilus assembly protein TadG
VETAIVLGTFLFMLLGILDLGLVVLQQNSLDAAAHRVARAAVVRGDMAISGESWGPRPYRSNGADAALIATTAREALVAINPEAVTITVAWPDGGNQPEQRVRVRMEYEHTAMLPVLYGRQLELRAECVMRIAH